MSYSDFFITSKNVFHFYFYFINSVTVSGVNIVLSNNELCYNEPKILENAC